MDWKFWYTLKKQINDSHHEELIKEDTMYLRYRFVDYLLLSKVMHNFKPNKVGWIGGFSNLDFFISQYGVDSIKECINVDGCPANTWLSRKHKQYKQLYGYQGKYTFHNHWYENKYFDGVDLLVSGTVQHDQIDPNILEGVHTLIFDHHSNPVHFDRLRESYNGLERRVLTENFAVFTSKDCDALFDDIKEFGKIINSDFRYKSKSSSTWNKFTKDVDDATIAECSIFESSTDWDDKIKPIMDPQRK